MQESCGVRSLISIIIILWLLSLSPSYTSFQHFNVSVREICHCVLPQKREYQKKYPLWDSADIKVNLVSGYEPAIKVNLLCIRRYQQIRGRPSPRKGKIFR